MRHKRILATLLLGSAAALLIHVSSHAQGPQQRQFAGPHMVNNILRIELTEESKEPASLVVTAIAEDPSGLLRDPQLLRAVYDKPPTDGIQDYFLLAVPPASGSKQARAEFRASNVWEKYRDEAPWIRDVRVHGIDSGLDIKTLVSR